MLNIERNTAVQLNNVDVVVMVLKWSDRLAHSTLKTSSSSNMKEGAKNNDVALIAFKFCQQDSKLCGC